MSEIANAVTDTVTDLFGDVSAQTETTEDAPVGEAAVQETEVAEVVELPDWEAASRDLFTEDDDDEPDFMALADEELSTGEAEEFAPNEFDDEQTAKLKREALAAKKQAEHFQRLHLRSSRKQWETDAKSQPWAVFAGDLSQIRASSHREFIKNAKATAKTNYEVLKPHLEKLQAAKTQLVAKATTEAEKTVQAAWGRPTVGGARVPADADQQSQQRLESGLAEARRSRSMFRATKAMIEEGQI